MTKLMPCLWFDDRIDEAIEFYTTTFKDSKVINLVRNSPDSAAFTAVIELAGQQIFLLNGGPCGWCKDKFGFSWQVVPKQMYETVLGPDKAGAGRAMQAMMSMHKLIIADLQKAYAGG
jgi:predicted 3-demethylubiquinone-9 3-methyltransferase (glyoxalase superfamily)